MVYYNIRYALKFGVVYQNANFKTGLTLTTPSFNFGGVGTVASDINAVNLKLDTENRVSGVATARQSELKTTFKSPLSLALGINYVIGKSNLGIAAQYFSGINTYTIMNVANSAFVRPADMAPNLGTDQFLRTPVGAKPVFNMALGYEYQFNKTVSFLASMRNDMSYFNDDINNENGIKTSLSSWDIYHGLVGITINHEESSLSLGLTYGHAKTKNYIQQGNLTNPSEGDLLKGVQTITEASYNSLGILVGYTFYLKRF